MATAGSDDAAARGGAVAAGGLRLGVVACTGGHMAATRGVGVTSVA
jgi:hypothetical protein